MPVELAISKASHFFMVNRISARVRPYILSFAKRMVQMGFMRSERKFIYTSLKVFAASTQSRNEYRFHINTLNSFLEHLRNNYIKDDEIELIELPAPIPVLTELKVRDHWVTRDYQQPAIDYILEDNENLAKFISLATGQGKGYISMRASSLIGERLLVLVRPMYIDKWVNELNEIYDLAPEDLLVVQGSNQLLALLNLANNGLLSAKVIIISNKTLQNWLKLYERFETQTLDMGYPCYPDSLCALLGVGVRIIDEVHQDFHLWFKIDCYTNVKKSISLSATLVSDDDFINRMYEVAYPAFYRYKGDAPKPHVTATSIIYRFANPNKIRYKDHISKHYSHHIFEQYILRNPLIKKNYFELIEDIFRNSYYQKRKPGHRCLIFCISIDMCTELTEYMRKKYPRLDVRRYVEDDEFENLIDADVSVSTMQSSGTAVDIPNLTTVIMTTAMASSQGNIQGFGRLRALKNDNTKTDFLYFVCEDIPKHIEYHEKKRMILRDRVKHYKSVHIGKPL